MQAFLRVVRTELFASVVRASRLLGVAALPPVLPPPHPSHSSHSSHSSKQPARRPWACCDAPVAECGFKGSALQVTSLGNMSMIGWAPPPLYVSHVWQPAASRKMQEALVEASVPGALFSSFEEVSFPGGVAGGRVYVSAVHGGSGGCGGHCDILRGLWWVAVVADCGWRWVVVGGCGLPCSGGVTPLVCTCAARGVCVP